MVPAGLKGYDLFLKDWKKTDNELGADFDLYSSASDLEAGVGAWDYCSYDVVGHGFPGDCGNKQNQWTSLSLGGQADVRFTIFSSHVAQRQVGFKLFLRR